MNFKRYLPVGALAFAMVLTLIMTETQAAAHRLNVFAWLKGDEVVVECNFGENRPAKNTLVTILDSTNGKRLIQGHANANGVFTFRVPSVVREGHGLTIDANAGEGHHNVWHMDASELYEAASLTAGFEEAALQGKPSGSEADAPPAGSAKDGASSAPALSSQTANVNVPLPEAATPEHVRSIVREELQNQMAPINRSLAQASLSRGVSIVEIIGGIGWIIGIIGLILYFRSRRGAN